MNLHSNKTSAATLPSGVAATWAGRWSTPAWSTEERLQRIEALGTRIESYVKFMRQSGNLGGASVEAWDRAVVAFYKRMLTVEKQLGAIHDKLRLESCAGRCFLRPGIHRSLRSFY